MERHLENRKKHHTVVVGDTQYASSYHDTGWDSEVLHPSFALRDLVCDRQTMSDYRRVFKVGGIDEEGLLHDDDDDKYSHAILDPARALIVDVTPKLIHIADSERCLNRIDMQSRVQELANSKYGLPCLMMFNSLRQIQVLEVVGLTDFLSNEFIRET